MIGLLKKLFGGKPAETTAEAPYKVETAPAVEAAPAPTIVMGGEPIATVIVEGAGQVEVKQQPAKKPAPKKQQFSKKPAASKAVQPKQQPKAKQPPKPKAKPTA